MSLEEYEDFVYGATNIDYAALEQTMQKVADAFTRAKKVRIVGKETDLTVDIEGREAVICSGSHNVPDGEFYFTPNHLLTEGHIYYDWPTVYGGREIQGIRLTFKEGKIVDFSAEKGRAFLENALNTDEGARYLGELGIGMNFGIQRPTKDILFDEKIGGSVHLAVGRAYEDAGAGNDSAIHWDMVKNLKDGGELYLDGVLVQKNGQWLI
jgi:aminopeptidase